MASNMKRTSTSSAVTAPTIAAASSAQDARLLVRETMRISANLASAPSPITVSMESRGSGGAGNGNGMIQPEFVESSLRLICCEEVDGRRWKYFVENGGGRKESIRGVCLQRPQAPVEELMTFIRSYVVPEGFPGSVSPAYVPYMSWRALKHFFGGAIGVFTTQTLLNSVGVSRSNAASGAVAISWILKDGAGRVGKMLFARQGKKFDCDLKQLRFAGDILMELGAGIELATAAVPHLFLPLACVANVAKNVAAVTSTSTRTPIYKAFATGENIGDVTAKGECVSNIADLIRSLVLHTLNRERFTVAVDSFLKTGCVPSLVEGNMKEQVFCLPWLKDKPVIIGSSFKDAFQVPAQYLAQEPLFEKERYMVTYNPEKHKVYALLKNEAKPDDIIKAAFHGYVLLNCISSAIKNQPYRGEDAKDQLDSTATSLDVEAHVHESCKLVSKTYGLFKSQAADQGWVMSESLLNPGRARMIS
ncbi:root UVB sensitive 6-like protein [Drosera capensis]